MGRSYPSKPTRSSPRLRSFSQSPNKRVKTSDGGNPPDRISLNIGGTRYEVSKAVVKKFPEESMLATICSEQDSSSNDEVFIDRNGQRFQYVLDFLRDGTVELPRAIAGRHLKRDLDFYGIDYEEDSITEAVDDEKDMFRGLVRYKNRLTLLEDGLDDEYKALLARKVAYGIAKIYLAVVSEGKAEAYRVYQLGFDEDVKVTLLCLRTGQRVGLKIIPRDDYIDPSELVTQIDSHFLKNIGLAIFNREAKEFGWQSEKSKGEKVVVVRLESSFS